MVTSSLSRILVKNANFLNCRANVFQRSQQESLRRILVQKFPSNSTQVFSTYVPPSFRYGEINLDESENNKQTDHAEEKKKLRKKVKSETIRRLQAMAMGELESPNPSQDEQPAARRSSDLLRLERKNPTRLSNRESGPESNSDMSPRDGEFTAKRHSFKQKPSQDYYSQKVPSFQRSMEKDISARPGHDILYGIHPISMALEAGKREFVQLWYRKGAEQSNPRLQKILQLCQERNIAINCTEEREFQRSIPSDRAHQGVAAETSRLTPVLLNEQDLAEEMPVNTLWTLLWEIQDPMNFGSIIRSGTFLGINRIFITKANSCSLTPVVSKASAGALEFVPIFTVPNSMSLLEKLRERDWEIVSTSSHANENSVALHEYQRPKKPTLLIIGNEGTGVPDEVTTMCTKSLYVAPAEHNTSFLDSLNVGAAAAVLFHTLSKQRN